MFACEVLLVHKIMYINMCIHIHVFWNGNGGAILKARYYNCHCRWVCVCVCVYMYGMYCVMRAKYVQEKFTEVSI